MASKCNIPYCSNIKYALGLCYRHYLRHYRGKPPDDKPAPVTPRKDGKMSYVRGGKGV